MRGQRKKMQMVRRGIRGLNAKVGKECSISRGARLYSEGVQVRGVLGKSRCDTSRDAAGGSSKSESCQEF